MPSIDIHMAIARNYLKKYDGIGDHLKFIKGSIAPDLASDTISSHYGKGMDDKDLALFLKNKIGLKEYLATNTIDNDYERGYFLHLLTDYMFFNYFFDKEYISKRTHKDFKKDLYYSYNTIHDYLASNYDISYEPFSDEVEKKISNSQVEIEYNGEKRINITPCDKIDKFINNILDKDINDYYEYFKDLFK